MSFREPYKKADKFKFLAESLEKRLKLYWDQWGMPLPGRSVWGIFTAQLKKEHRLDWRRFVVDEGFASPQLCERGTEFLFPNLESRGITDDQIAKCLVRLSRAKQSDRSRALVESRYELTMKRREAAALAASAEDAGEVGEEN